MENLVQVFIMAILVEAIWESLKMVWQDGKFNIDNLGALVVGQVMAFTIGIDIFNRVGLESKFTLIGIIATGILISRGGNFIHDLFKRLGDD